MSRKREDLDRTITIQIARGNKKTPAILVMIWDVMSMKSICQQKIARMKLLLYTAMEMTSISAKETKGLPIQILQT